MTFWDYGFSLLRYTNPAIGAVYGFYDLGKSMLTYDVNKAYSTESTIYKDVKGLVTGTQETITTVSKSATILAIIGALIYFNEKKKW